MNCGRSFNSALSTFNSALFIKAIALHNHKRYLMAIAGKLNVNYQAYLLIDNDFLAPETRPPN
ncbi:hypothetical protein H6G74_04170 [Nostoc spongiaeforme FACHB-130]|uniref:Uncharacterized protein n=1 Tax=Nostoc spongiaeforme FACHB-130 TaxID=1357510 RepID=A0ABR8FPY6_9NOSO|nr:hypothetical protein [Nostoc spongiaeforme]MBD2593524.1 hypothetical protein [Nostoc spongiaeforme FACHB-130]